MAYSMWRFASAFFFLFTPIIGWPIAYLCYKKGKAAERKSEQEQQLRDKQLEQLEDSE